MFAIVNENNEFKVNGLCSFVKDSDDSSAHFFSTKEAALEMLDRCINSLGEEDGQRYTEAQQQMIYRSKKMLEGSRVVKLNISIEEVE